MLRALVRYEMDDRDHALRLLRTLPREHTGAAAVRVLVSFGTGRYPDVVAEYDTRVRPHFRALVSAQPHGAAVASLATAAACTALVESGAAPEALALTREALDLLPDALPERLPPLIVEVDCLTSEGRLVEAHHAAEALRDWGLATHGPQATGAGLAYLGVICAAHGSHHRAAAHMREATGLAYERNFLHVRRRRLALLAGYEAVCGNFDAARAAIREATREGRSGEEFAAMLLRNAQALLLACGGALRDAADHLRRSADHAAARGAPGRTITALHLLARLGHARDAARRLADADVDRSPVSHAQVGHIRALVDRDPAALLDVAAEWERMRMWHLAAEANDVAAAALS
ncbi:hypothetical protein AB0G02_41645, partial [Actinosynnema sp. NPDC023658]|uniref:hypothetical protein n=1 Tax=Actinosynnema sp. NPDC023658 TaxID=3155465 RepID=UPI0033F77D10